MGFSAGYFRKWFGFKGYFRQQISGVTVLGASKMSEDDMSERVSNINY